VETTNKIGWSPLNLAAFQGHVDVVQELLKHNANVETTNNNGWTPLRSAAYNGHVKSQDLVVSEK
jgi:ankyrin repeat protein